MADEAAPVGGTSPGVPVVGAMVVAVLSVGRMQAAVDGGWTCGREAEGGGEVVEYIADV